MTTEPKQQMLATARELALSGITPGTSGNLSLRDGVGMWLTPSGVDYLEMTEDQLVYMDMDGNWSGPWNPTSEWRFHRDILAGRTDINAICHVHSPHATALACRRESIPAFHYVVALAGGMDIRCAEYAIFGSQQLSDNILVALQDRRACLLANHGMVALGKDVQAAYKLAQEVEALAQQYILARQSGEPVILSEDEMQAVLTAFQTYGHQPARDG